MQLPDFKSRVVPVVSLDRVDHALPLAHALLAGGIDVIEITLRRPGGLPAIERLARDCPEIRAGAGTLLSVEDVARAHAAGARFGLSPGLDPEVIEAARWHGMPFIPGVMTPTEAMQARALGCTLLKLFPAEQAGGVGMLRALRGPLPDLSFCPTGGIGPDNFSRYLAEPSVRMVGGSWLTPANLIEAGDWRAIEHLATQAMRAG
jgi:2-dehydro-3-deoxyphosphogluconate aldolase/(4S)-4-hydroxy-2-oxoglutarate aldolase